MKELRSVLEETGIRTAVIIDDVFDEVPRPYELADDDWTVFFDDLGDEDKRLLASLYTSYEDESLEDLKASQDFISIVRENREKLPTTAADLFSSYESTNDSDREKLDALVERLESFGLQCTTMGRDPDETVQEADLIIIDLFLGFQQVENDMERAVSRVKNLLQSRAQRPPLVVLMSRSSRLHEKRNSFREEVGLLGSTFRVISKTELSDSNLLERLLRRLADNYEDAKRVAGFIHAWDIGLDQARKQFIRVLRQLDLSDLAQVGALLLQFEGQKLGEYLLDVADGVLQHEIEGNDNTIKAAVELNKIDMRKYPAPHLAGSPDLQDMVYRMVFMHSSRLLLSEKDGKVQLQFGDLLRWKKLDGKSFSDDVSLVVTPACDLMRRGVDYVMLLPGKLESLEPKNWSYKEDPVRTPIVDIAGENRKWIRWDLKNVKTLSWSKLDDLFGGQEQLRRMGRLREIYAIEIQQMFLANLGRVGRPANLPVPFPVDVSFFYVGTDSKAKKLDIEVIESAACYVGRDERSNPIHRLVLTEQACDKIENALRALDATQLKRSARASFENIQKDSGFFSRLERGEIEVPEPGAGAKYIKVEDQIAALVLREDSFSEGCAIKGNQAKSGLIIRVTDV